MLQVDSPLSTGVPYLKVSGLSDAIPGIEHLLKLTFCNRLPSQQSRGDITVVLTGTGEAVVEFESHEGEHLIYLFVVNIYDLITDCICLASIDHSFLGQNLQVELCYKAQQVAEVLVIKGLPAGLPADTVQRAMEHVLKQKTEVAVDKFVVEKNIAYITFTDCSGIIFFSTPHCFKAGHNKIIFTV